MDRTFQRNLESANSSMAYDFSNVNSIALLDIELSMIVTNEV